MKKIAIFGAGGFGREVQMLIEQLNESTAVYHFIGYFDDGPDLHGKSINGFPVLGGFKDLNQWQEPIQVVFAIGNPIIKKKLVSNISNPNLAFPVLIHPRATIGSEVYTKIGEGSIICAGTIITVNISIGKHVILNLSCTVGHDTSIGDYCSFMPTVNISGEVKIGECVFFGTGAQIINQRDVGENSVIGAGAVITKSIPPNCVAVGMPAQPVKYF